MSSEDKDTLGHKDSNSSEPDENVYCSDESKVNISEVVSNNVKESQGVGKVKYQSDASSIQVNLPKKELPNISPISHQSGTNLAVKDERSSISEEDSSENLEGLDWSCSGSRENGSAYGSQRPKTVSFHTGSSIPAERKISNGKSCKLNLLIKLISLEQNLKCCFPRQSQNVLPIPCLLIK